MQKFADKYTQDNPGVFNSAGACYTLCYLLMMLQTSCHNPQVPEEDKMNLKSFSSCARGINDGEDFPKEMMKVLYENILLKPIAVHELMRRKNEKESSESLTLKKKQDLFKKETESILRVSRQ